MILFLQETNKPLYFNEEFPDSQPRTYFTKKYSSSGLSGGAIAAIVIGCIVVLVALSIIFIVLKKREEKQKQLHSSAIDFYNYNYNDNNYNSTVKINADEE